MLPQPPPPIVTETFASLIESALRKSMMQFEFCEMMMMVPEEQKKGILRTIRLMVLIITWVI